MAKSATVRVGYEGKNYDIPLEISEANSRQPGIAAAWIQDQIQAEADRKASAKAASDLNVEREFKSVKQKLAQVDAHEEQGVELGRREVVLRELDLTKLAPQLDDHILEIHVKHCCNLLRVLADTDTLCLVHPTG